nr:hypothetical protein [Tanacetum cinerariifolium]
MNVEVWDTTRLDCGSNRTNVDGGVSGGAFDCISVVDAFNLKLYVLRKLVYVELFVVLSMVMIMGSLKNEDLEYHRRSVCGYHLDLTDLKVTDPTTRFRQALRSFRFGSTGCFKLLMGFLGFWIWSLAGNTSDEIREVGGGACRQCSCDQQ